MDELHTDDTAGSTNSVVDLIVEQPTTQEAQPDSLIGETTGNATASQQSSQQPQQILPMTHFKVPSELQIPLIVLVRQTLM
jgi:hypothetical protein